MSNTALLEIFGIPAGFGGMYLLISSPKTRKQVIVCSVIGAYDLIFSLLSTGGSRSYECQAPKARHIFSLGRRPRYPGKRRKRAEGPTHSIFSKPQLFALSSTFILLVGCFRPDDIKVIPTPTPGLSFTEQTYKGRGAIDNDYTHVYVRLDRDGKSSKMEVLSGTYVVLNRILWSSPTEAVLCMQPGGFTDEFHSQVTLQKKNDQSLSIHFLLREDC